MEIIVFVVYIAIVFAICYAVARPQLKAKKRYGKDEFLFLGKLKFAAGLNLPQNVMCNVICLRSRVVILSSGQEFSLPVEKIIDVSVMTNTEIQKQYVSSIGGAVAGAVLLGPIGAVVGGAAHQKRIKTNSKYLIFSYRGEEETKYILFDVTKKISVANKFKKRFKGLKKRESTKIDL